MRVLLLSALVGLSLARNGGGWGGWSHGNKHGGKHGGGGKHGHHNNPWGGHHGGKGKGGGKGHNDNDWGYHGKKDDGKPCPKKQQEMAKNNANNKPPTPAKKTLDKKFYGEYGCENKDEGVRERVKIAEKEIDVGKERVEADHWKIVSADEVEFRTREGGMDFHLNEKTGKVWLIQTNVDQKTRKEQKIHMECRRADTPQPPKPQPPKPQPTPANMPKEMLGEWKHEKQTLMVSERGVTFDEKRVHYKVVNEKTMVVLLSEEEGVKFWVESKKVLDAEKFSVKPDDTKKEIAELKKEMKVEQEVFDKEMAEDKKAGAAIKEGFEKDQEALKKRLIEEKKKAGAMDEELKKKEKEEAEQYKKDMGALDKREVEAKKKYEETEESLKKREAEMKKDGDKNKADYKRVEDMEKQVAENFKKQEMSLEKGKKVMTEKVKKEEGELKKKDAEVVKKEKEDYEAAKKRAELMKKEAMEKEEKLEKKEKKEKEEYMKKEEIMKKKLAELEKKATVSDKPQSEVFKFYKVEKKEQAAQGSLAEEKDVEMVAWGSIQTKKFGVKFEIDRDTKYTATETEGTL